MDRIILGGKVGTKAEFEALKNTEHFVKINDCEFYLDRQDEGDILYLIVNDKTGKNFVKTNELY